MVVDTVASVSMYQIDCKQCSARWKSSCAYLKAVLRHWRDAGVDAGLDTSSHTQYALEYAQIHTAMQSMPSRCIWGTECRNVVPLKGQLICGVRICAYNYIYL